MKKYILGLLGLGLMVGMISCEPSNPYNIGPGYDYAGNLQKDSIKIAAYLDTAKFDSLYRIHHESGMVIIVQEEGELSRPSYGNIIYNNYVGRLMEEGTVFDTNIKSVAEDNGLHEEGDTYNPYGFELLQLNPSNPNLNVRPIPGFHFGFEKLRSGSKAVLIIPSAQAYRDQASEKIPANSVLVFEVEFLGMD